METFTFKTNINCSGCLAKVTPFLNAEQGVDTWGVDLSNPDKTLTVEACDIDTVIQAVQKAGFKIEPKTNESTH